MKNKCNCEFCELFKLRLEALKNDDIEVVKKALVRFSEEWLHVSDNANYYESILDGSWASAEKLLTESLEKVREVKRNS